jgi:hypothetical protein
MIILVQASYFIYSLAIDVGSIVTSTTLSLVDPNFFKITLDNLSNIGLEMVFSLFYLLALIFSIVVLILRYIVVSVGVVFFPLGIFAYFLEPIKPYGKLIINFLGVGIFVTFLDALILIGFSQLASLPLFTNFKVLVTITCFGTISFAMIFLMFFSAIKSGIGIGTKVVSVVAKVGAMAA